jgi:hypothetical protein
MTELVRVDLIAHKPTHAHTHTHTRHHSDPRFRPLATLVVRDLTRVFCFASCLTRRMPPTGGGKLMRILCVCIAPTVRVKELRAQPTLTHSLTHAICNRSPPINPTGDSRGSLDNEFSS